MKNMIFIFLHFSNTGVFEKWQCIHAPRGISDKSEIPYRRFGVQEANA